MPEGDTVWRTARRLDQALSGRPLTESDFRVPRWAHIDLVGQTVEETVSRGKHLLTRLPEVTVHTHLKMEGSWHVYRPTSRWRAPAHQARLVLGNEEWRAVGFQLGTVEVVERSAEHAVVGHLGPDILGADWSLDEATRRLLSDPGRPVVAALLDQRNVAGASVEPHIHTIGEALLDQRNLAGLGTVYMAEALFLAGVSPLTPVPDVPGLAKVVQIARRLLLANRDQPMQVTTGVVRKGQEHWVYRRAGQPCRRCRTAIATASVGRRPYDRVTYWCPSCQP
jgi:endonuclease-8